MLVWLNPISCEVTWYLYVYLIRYWSDASTIFFTFFDKRQLNLVGSCKNKKIKSIYSNLAEQWCAAANKYILNSSKNVRVCVLCCHHDKNRYDTKKEEDILSNKWFLIISLLNILILFFIFLMREEKNFRGRNNKIEKRKAYILNKIKKKRNWEKKASLAS